ncbi:hypothetical protein SEUCBS139899_005166 [Sporothrix eucalyptigena]|uniref:rRNA-processing protein FYV7 n=1 Tax=Sporothrix eucalyptigena TaxID=1812306 RepID=A0ABP0AJY1_9PEZI
MGKRSADDAGNTAHKPKRSRDGIRAALPTSDDAWRRKLEKAKESKVIRAKTLQAYAKVKARALAGEDGEKKTTDADDDAVSEAEAPMHPERQARIDNEGEGNGSDGNGERDAQRERRPRGNRPPKRAQPYFQKAREEAAQKMAEAEARKAEFERRAAEREEAIAQRKRHQKAMAKARRVDTRGGGNRDGGDNQRRKLGRESGVLLDRVKKMMGK